MSESSGASQSRKNKSEKLPAEEQLGRPAPEERADESVTNADPENPPEIPDWLLELEKKPVVIPFDVVAPEDYSGQDRSSQIASLDGATDEPLQDDLPDWLKLDRKAPARVEKQMAPEDQIPEWLRKGLEDLQEPSAQATDGGLPAGENIPPVFAQTADLNEWPDPQERRPVGSHPLPSWLEDQDQPAEAALSDEPSIQPDQPETGELPEAGPTTPPAPPGIEALADVRQTLKEDEQTEAPQKRPGLLERMAGPILASRLIKTDRSEPDQENNIDRPDLTTAAGQEYSESPEFPAELLAEPAETFADDAQNTEAVSAQPDDSSIDDWLSEVGEDAIPAVEKKPSRRSLFGFKKADGPEEPAITDEQLERRLLIALSAASDEESSPPTAADATEDLESTSSIFQEEEFDLHHLTDYEDEEAIFDVEEQVSPVDLEEAEDQWLEASLAADLDQTAPIEESEMDEAGESEIDLREVALQDYVEAPHEPEGGPVDIFIDKAIRRFNNFSPLQKLALIGLVLVNIGLVMILGLFLLLSLFPSQATSSNVSPPPTNLPVSGPYPVQVILPGGWSFEVKPGALQEGAWMNQGAEWLQGTEITRWIALPWSKQLEAVAITLQPTDHIELVMSNRDRLKYKIESVVEVPVEKVTELNLNSPSLLLILANQNSNTRVVVIGSLISDQETK
jgi:hypothetical protein